MEEKETEIVPEVMALEPTKGFPLDDAKPVKLTGKDLEPIQDLDFPDNLPDAENVAIDGNATVILPAKVYAPWIKAIQGWLKQAGAENSIDFKATVSTAGGTTKDGKALYKIHWIALTEKGKKYLLLMAASLQRKGITAQGMLRFDNENNKRRSG